MSFFCFWVEQHFAQPREVDSMTTLAANVTPSWPSSWKQPGGAAAVDVPKRSYDWDAKLLCDESGF